MAKTIEDACMHELILMVRNDEDGKGGFIKIGDCYDCSSTRVITDAYRHVSSDVYILIQRKEINARNCRE